ncbi:MAG TPA: hypothetical protein DIW51_15740 [Rhodospirillaceae bacterium]|nr:hypothetical protein [Magnetovibrio sp.]HBT43545.1 hypothetical protein [Rhodospirillaceae bacterium]HCS71415.1 hypothetical protein [Rhodospirillaceae bacterium]
MAGVDPVVSMSPGLGNLQSTDHFFFRPLGKHMITSLVPFLRVPTAIPALPAPCIRKTTSWPRGAEQ